MDRKKLVETLELASRALADSNLIPIFQCFAFTGETVLACNDNLAVVAPCQTDEAFAVNGGILLGLLKNSHSEDVEFAFGEGNDLMVKAGRSTFKLPWFPVEDFLFTPPTEPSPIRIPINEELIDGLTACLMTVSKDQAQAALMGICLTEKQHRVTLYSTDGDAISRYTTSCPAKGTFSYLINNSFCETVIKTFAAFEPKRGILGVSEDWAVANLDAGSGLVYSVYGRLIEPDNPIDYEDWIKKTIKRPPQFIALPKGLEHALSRARVVADPESAKTVMTVDANRVKLLTETAMGVVRDTLAFGKHPGVTAAVSAELMQRCASLCSEMAILENCCCFKNEDKLFILTSNMG